MTTAETIAKRFDDDGQCLLDANGFQLAEVCTAHASWTSIRPEGTRYDFADGSAIVVCGSAWDLGFDGTGCLCWQGAGHHQDCSAGLGRGS